ncbi:Aste57867_4126 [Aphanomyces stellatus]|uniref:Aste57867_4126 protein n=1 Tax=Aphanomyces stellatus TaxID=120398 RepID=A0A485KAZ3_9STRA|nr:hypothetical protein As57867_004115 [Aphanomyces stellatus]VFT81256.1 Aste57867_4126 [Aphanomyces stellatus]
MERTLQAQVDGARALADKAEWLVVMGGYFRDIDDLGKATQCVHDALHIYRHDLNDSHPDTWDSLCGTADLVEMAIEPRAVWEPMFQEALAHETDLLGRDHVNSLQTVFSLGSCQILHEACSRTQGLTLPLTIETLAITGECLVRQNKFDDAEVSLRKCYALKCQGFGPDHPNTQKTTSQLSTVYIKQGQFDQAATLNQQVFDVYFRTLGPTHRETIASHINIGHTKLLAGQYDDAKVFYHLSPRRHPAHHVLVLSPPSHARCRPHPSRVS